MENDDRRHPHRPDPLLPFRMPWRGLWVCVRTGALLFLLLLLCFPALMLVGQVAGLFDRFFLAHMGQTRTRLVILQIFTLPFLYALFWAVSVIAHRILQRHFEALIVVTASWLVVLAKLLALALSIIFLDILPLREWLGMDSITALIMISLCSITVADAVVLGAQVPFRAGRRLSPTWQLGGISWLLLTTAVVYGGWLFLAIRLGPQGAEVVGLPVLLALICIGQCLWVALPWLLLEARHPEAEVSDGESG